MEKLAYRLDDAREMLGGISRTALYREINAGNLVRIKIGKSALITAESLRKRVEQAAA